MTVEILRAVEYSAIMNNHLVVSCRHNAFSHFHFELLQAQLTSIISSTAFYNYLFMFGFAIENVHFFLSRFDAIKYESVQPVASNVYFKR